MAKKLFQKGQSGNPAGRPEGAGSKALKAFREIVNEKITLDDLLTRIDSLSARDQVIFRLKLLEFGQPKLRSIEISDMTTIEQLMSMSKEERMAKLLELKRRHEHG